MARPAAHVRVVWLIMRGAALRSVAELLGHQSMKMTTRYAHLSPAFLSAEASLLDPPPPAPAPPAEGKKSKGHLRPCQIGLGPVLQPIEFLL